MTATVRTDTVGTAPPSPRMQPWVWTALAFAVLAVAGIGGSLLWRAAGSAGGAQPLQVNFEQLTDQEGSETFPSLSPDGDELVYIRATSPGNLDVYSQRVGGSNPRNLTEDSLLADTQPAFSPDGQQIVFRSERDDGGLFLMGATGESVRRLTEMGFNPAWSPDGRKIAFATEEVSGPLERRLDNSELWVVDVATNESRRVYKGDAVQPSWSPGGNRIAFWGLPKGSTERVIWTIPAGGGEPVQVTRGGHLDWNPVWSPDGRYLYFVSDPSGTMNVWRVPIDEETGKVRGAPEPITSSPQSLGLLSVSRDTGKIAYGMIESKSNLERISFDPVRGEVAGVLKPVTQGSRAVRSASTSPDGQWIAFDTSFPQEDLFIVRPDGTGQRQLTNDAARDRVPRWSPDGSRILFYSDRGGSGSYGAWTIRPDASGLQELPHGSTAPFYSPLWSPDGQRLAGSLEARGGVLVDLLPTGPKLRPLPSPGRNETFDPTSWSADGTTLAGTLTRTGSSKVPGVVLHTLGSGRYERLTDSGETPRWLNDRSLVYLDGGKIFLYDLTVRRARLLLDPPPGSVFKTVNVSPAGDSLDVVRTTDEGDVWLLTFGNPRER